MCIHAQHLAFIHTGARRRAGRIGAANLNAGADGEAARRQPSTIRAAPPPTAWDVRRPSGRPQRKRRPQTRQQPSINPLFVRSSTSNYAKPPTNKPRQTNRKTQARKKLKRIQHRRTCVGSASLKYAQPSSRYVFSYSVLSVENNLYLCTDVVLRHRALCGCCFGDPAFLQKLSNCCQIFFVLIYNLLNIGFIG